jgi:serine/threonine protein kinase
MIGQRLLHYEVVEKLGEGGMGVVYKARDTHLDRFVAIKVLPPERVADSERKARFVQEAKADSALNHPNIITVHDAGESDGSVFIVMEYVPGKPLTDLISRKGMGLNETLRYPKADGPFCGYSPLGRGKFCVKRSSNIQELNRSTSYSPARICRSRQRSVVGPKLGLGGGA